MTIHQFAQRAKVFADRVAPIILVISACCLAMLAGCGGPGIRLVPVTGTLTLDGSPLVQKTVRFQPEPGTPGHGGGATTNAQGQYSLIALIPGSVKDFKGIAPGNYRVTVVDRMFGGESLPVQGKTTEPEVAIGPGTTPATKEVPSVYAKPETTPLIVMVPEDGGTLDLKLESK